jgi:hypothetical protein
VIFKLVLLGALKYWLVPFSESDRNVLWDLVAGVRNEIATTKQNNNDNDRCEERDIFLSWAVKKTGPLWS